MLALVLTVGMLGSVQKTPRLPESGLGVALGAGPWGAAASAGRSGQSPNEAWPDTAGSPGATAASSS